MTSLKTLRRNKVLAKIPLKKNLTILSRIFTLGYFSKVVHSLLSVSLQKGGRTNEIAKDEAFNYYQDAMKIIDSLEEVNINELFYCCFIVVGSLIIKLLYRSLYFRTENLINTVNKLHGNFKT